ncbi:hypothetical protein GA0115260_109204, partial [Streptomyces sp. MnatMP-M27]
ARPPVGPPIPRPRRAEAERHGADSIVVDGQRIAGP